MMSGRDPQRYRDEALAAGASAYLSKPIDVDDLVLAIRVALGEDLGGDATAAQGGVAGGRLGDILKDMGLVTEEQIASALARQSEVALGLRPHSRARSSCWSTTTRICSSRSLRRCAGRASTSPWRPTP